MQKTLRLVASALFLILPTAALALTISVTGSWDGSDPTMSPRVGAFGTQSTCAAPKAFPGTFGSDTYPYDLYTFYNSGPAECVTVTQQANDPGVNLFVIAYDGSFDPDNLATGYLADGGLRGVVVTYSFTAPADSLFQLVAISSLAVSGSYEFLVTGESISRVAEPATLTLAGLGLLLLAAGRRRRR